MNQYNNNNDEHAADKQKNLLFQTVGIFIDAENIELSGLKHHEGRTDYRKIIDKVGDREIIRILYYKPDYKEISEDFQTFWSSLGGEIKRPAKNADSFIVVDAVTMADKLDVVIILGGDKDYLPLVWYLKSRGCRVEIWSWPETTSPEIKQAADFYFPLDTDFIVSEGKSKGSSSPSKNYKPSAHKNEKHEPANKATIISKPATHTTKSTGHNQKPQNNQKNQKQGGGSNSKPTGGGSHPNKNNYNKK